MILRHICFPLLLLATIGFVDVAADEQKVTITITREDDSSPFQGHRPAVDVAVLLDTSNSMDGLISQAKNQLWQIVQEFADARREGNTPYLRVALFEYGNNGLPASEGYLRQVVPLSDDLDEISEALFALSTNGGDEYCGQVIQQALVRLDWSTQPDAYRAIFIAGNEPFTQGSVDYTSACRAAIEKGIVVNTIHCGNQDAGITGKWKHGADLAEGEFFNINQDRKEVYIKTPHDEIILRLNAELNKTYLWYGSRAERKRFLGRQMAQDELALNESRGTALQRANAKAGASYQNAQRDLVDALRDNEDALEEIDAEELPEPLQEMDSKARVEFVKKNAERREALQRQIAELTAKRNKIVQEKMQATDGQKSETLGSAITQAIRSQLSKSGFATKSAKN